MNKRFVITTAVGLVFATTALAQSPSGSSYSSTTQPSATTTRSTPTTAPSTSHSAPAATAPSGTSAQSTPPASNTTTTQNRDRAPSNSGTAQSQPSQPSNPSAAQSAPATQQPATSQAQTPSRSNQPATNNAQAPSSNTNVNTTTNIAPQERTQIAQSISRLNVQPLANVNFSVAVGRTIPRNVRLRPLPTDVVRGVPQYRGYNFVLVRDEIVIVEPSTYRIVDVLPRSGGRTAAAPVPKKTIRFSNRERAVIRRHVTTERDRFTVGSTARAQVRVGDRVPDTVELREFPSTIYRTVPSVREYRYMQLDDRSYLVEPQGRMIIEEID